MEVEHGSPSCREPIGALQAKRNWPGNLLVSTERHLAVGSSSCGEGATLAARAPV